MAHDVFISYSHKDEAVADAVCHELESYGIRCWYAPRNIEAGQSWAAAIVAGIRGCRVFVLIFSGSSNASQQVLNEITNAVNFGKIIVPFRIDVSEMSDDMTYYLSSRHWLDAVTPPLMEHIRALREQLSSMLDIPYVRESSAAEPAGLQQEPVPAEKDEKREPVISREELEQEPVSKLRKKPVSRRQSKGKKPEIYIPAPIEFAQMEPLTRPVRPRQILSSYAGSVIAVSADGTAICDSNLIPDSVESWGNLIEVSQSGTSITGLHLDGTVSIEFDGLTIMEDIFGIIRHRLKKARKWKDIIQVRSGFYAVYGLRADGHVLCAANDADERKRIEQWKDIVAITTASDGATGLKSDGTIVSTMRDRGIWAKPGDIISIDWKDIVSIAGGENWLVGLKSDGTIEYTNNREIGIGSMMELPSLKEWNHVIQIAAGDKMILGLRDDSAILCAGIFDDNPPDFRNWKDICSIAVDGSEAVAYGIRTDGSVICTSESAGKLISDWRLQQI